jgi:F420-0:gamma-glutamyl ligase
MERNVGAVARGIRGPIIKPNDDLVKIVADTLVTTIEAEEIKLQKNDILGITEAVVAKAQNNFVSLTDIKEDIAAKYNNEIGVVFPILSRNRFSNILKAIALAVDKVYIQLSYPADEVGNKLVSWDAIDDAGINPYTDVLTEAQFYELFKSAEHNFTGVDYVQLYKTICDGKATIIFSNDPKAILKYTKNVLAADIHTRTRTKKILKNAGAEVVYSLDEIMTQSINGSGYNPQYGLLGSNLAPDDKLKLFPRDGNDFVYAVQKELIARIGVEINVLIYGDGGFKDPVGGIWELADPVITPGFTAGLAGEPSEIKLKYVADTLASDLDQDATQEEIKNLIHNKAKADANDALGTTPRKLVDLLGSLCDLMSGSGDKGTPFILIQGYFDNYAD